MDVRARPQIGKADVRLGMPFPHVVSALTPRVHLIVVGAVGKRRALLHKIQDPGGDAGMRKVPVAGLDLGRNGGGARHLAAFGIDLDQTGNLVLQ
jgi:hypothetical protein